MKLISAIMAAVLIIGTAMGVGSAPTCAAVDSRASTCL